MLNLLRVELRKIFRGKALWIVTGIFLVAIYATFIPLSYMDEAGDMLRFSDERIQEEMDKDPEAIQQADIFLEAARSGGSFSSAFFSTSNGQIAVCMTLVMIFVLSDFATGAVSASLLAGYSRGQLYRAKLLACVLGCCAYTAIAGAGVYVLGALFYGMPLTAQGIQSALLICLAQCLMSVLCTAIFVAAAYVFGNGFAVLASILFLCLLPGAQLLFSLSVGSPLTFAAAHLPSLVAAMGEDGGFMTLEQMVALPQLWTAGFLLKAALSLVILTAASTAVGQFAFRRKRL